MNYCWAGPKRPGGPQRMRKRSPATTRPRLAPALAQRLTMGPHTTERKTGEEEETVAQLVAGGISGESSGTTMFASSKRI